MLLTFCKLIVALNLCQTFCAAMPNGERFIRATADNELLALQLADADGDLNPFNAAKHSSTEERIKRQTTNNNNNNDDFSEFNRNDVSFDISGDVINQSFKALTNVSKTISNFIMNTARRYSRFMLFFKPLFGDALMIKGFEDPTTTTTTTTTTTPRTTTMSTIKNVLDERFNEI